MLRSEDGSTASCSSGNPTSRRSSLHTEQRPFYYLRTRIRAVRKGLRAVLRRACGDGDGDEPHREDDGAVVIRAITASCRGKGIRVRFEAPSGLSSDDAEKDARA